MFLKHTNNLVQLTIIDSGFNEEFWCNLAEKANLTRTLLCLKAIETKKRVLIKNFEWLYKFERLQSLTTNLINRAFCVQLLPRMNLRSSITLYFQTSVVDTCICSVARNDDRFDLRLVDMNFQREDPLAYLSNKLSLSLTQMAISAATFLTHPLDSEADFALYTEYCKDLSSVTENLWII